MPFYVEIIDGIGKPPLKITASQLVVRLADGTPVSLAAEFGGNAVKVAHCNDEDFTESLTKLGINETVIIEKLKDN
jgi:hypothetical protein